MTKPYIFISAICFALLNICFEGTAQNTAVMNVSVNVVSGSLITSTMSNEIDMEHGSVQVGALGLQSDDNQNFMINLDPEVQITNADGQRISIATSISELQSTVRGKRYYVIEGQITEKSDASRGLFKGTLSATINYL